MKFASKLLTGVAVAASMATWIALQEEDLELDTALSLTASELEEALLTK